MKDVTLLGFICLCLRAEFLPFVLSFELSFELFLESSREWPVSLWIAHCRFFSGSLDSSMLTPCGVAFWGSLGPGLSLDPHCCSACRGCLVL